MRNIVPKALRTFGLAAGSVLAATGHWIGWLHTQIVLGLVFYLVLTPIGLLMRLLGANPIDWKWQPERSTYRIVRESRPGSHMTRQF